MNSQTKLFLHVLLTCNTEPQALTAGTGSRFRKDITLEEVAQHRTKEDAWTVLRGKVYTPTEIVGSV